jgi:hypothetical protein
LNFCTTRILGFFHACNLWYVVAVAVRKTKKKLGD